MLLLLSQSALAQRLLYRVDLKHSGDHYVGVTLQPVGMRPDTLTFQMPVWAPGVYSTVHYGQFVQDFQAFDTKGGEMKVVRVNDDRWRVPGAENIGEIRYRVRDSRDDKNSPLVGLAKIESDEVLANGVTLFGYVDDDKNIPVTLSYSLPQDWMIATPLSPATEDDEVSVQSRLHQTIYNADDYEELVDAPILAAPTAKRVAVWHDKNSTYYVVGAGSSGFPIDSFAVLAKSIVRAEVSFFHGWPFDEYMFLIDEGSTSRPMALTHDGSSVYTIADGSWADQKEYLKHTIASTLFKTWNGKQFHISELGPVDYSQPISAKSLWFNEGGSDYFAELLLTRYGLMSQTDFYKHIDELTALEGKTPDLPLEEISMKQTRYDESMRRSLCLKGALATMMLDLEIRNKSNGKSSLDQVLAKMNTDVKSGTTYDDKQLVEVIGKYAKVDLKDFDSLYIEGKTPIPVDTYLELAGASRRANQLPGLPQPIAFDFALLENGAVINKIISDTSPVGIRTGDTLLMVDGKKATGVSIAELSKSLSSGHTVPATLLKDRKAVGVTIKGGTPPNQQPNVALAALKKPSARQLAMRNAWLGKRKLMATNKKEN